MKSLTFLIGVFLAFPLFSQESNDRVVISVKRNYKPKDTENAVLVFDWNELKKRVNNLKPSNLLLVDQHFVLPIEAKIIDANGDGKPESVTADVTFKSNEPVFGFMVSAKGQGSKVIREAITPDPRFEITYLVPYASNGQKIADRIIESTIHTYPDTKDLSIISPGKWTYEYGFFLNAAYVQYENTKNEKYLSYIKSWVDNFITTDGSWRDGVYDVEEYRLDDILPGRLCIYLYQKTGEEKYKKIADQFIAHLSRQPKTSEGGYWHKKIYPNQMWLDGIYMGDIFSTQYAAAFNEPHWFDEAVQQINLMYKHAYDPSTGLLFHGWDESKNKVWANQETGTSPEFWSRAVGWYAMALIDCLDYLPKDHPQRKNIELIFQKLCGSIRNFQDKKTGLWFQITDKGNLKDNWIETSSSAMFSYAFAKGANKGILDKSYTTAAEKAYSSILKNYIYQDNEGYVHLDQAVKVGSLNIKNSKGDYPYYIGGERRLDDYKGLAALLYASIELKK
ncbi:MAG: glycoside hydrolase family 88 protein [Cyclobacteriaceae bacterium]|nr:glycoside hydrolase family 88 protein [Cyclobacteriaceae bacterium]